MPFPWCPCLDRQPVAASLRDIALAHFTRLEAILSVQDSPARKAFDAFLAEIRGDLNSGITEQEAVEMLAQHTITRPVFDALFEGHRSAKRRELSHDKQLWEQLREECIPTTPPPAFSSIADQR